MTSSTLEARFWQKVAIGPGDCWNWTAAKAGKGYGVIGLGRFNGKVKNLYAHRVSWEIHNGPIPEGLEVTHTCLNHGCVNPRHLFLATRQQIIHRTVQEGRHGNQKLSKESVAKIRSSHPGTSYQKLAREHGIYKATVADIVKQRSWRHVV